VEAIIRPFTADDLDAVLEFSIRAWDPVFASMRSVLGAEIFGRMHQDWAAEQRAAVAKACQTKEVWVADAGGVAVGFTALDLRPESNEGEIWMLAVDPDHQSAGLGTALSLHAIDRMREAGLAIGIVETGGDAGHAPARRTYEKAGFTLMPIARYFVAL
jgi:ribosomal protein S18 acetylase RimI-like enzyme